MDHLGLPRIELQSCTYLEHKFQPSNKKKNEVRSHRSIKLINIYFGRHFASYNMKAN